jgi:hypothetical protein
MYYYRIDDGTVATLGEAREIVIRLGESTKDGIIRASFATKVGDDPRLKTFAARD